MADDQKDIVISKTNSGFPGYLDFDKLRTEGIDYLGSLSGKIWTDYNVHDPGITILEILCYALLDLGYRTNLPIEDLLTSDPEIKSLENNFFTPAQVLTCNPLTITDFRKLLIDIDGVRNAWLVVATDQKDICRQKQEPTPQTQPVPGAVLRSFSQRPDEKNDCINFLNGLYHVYIDLETDVEKYFEDRPEKEKFDFLQDKERKIRNALMSHRNFCEDFIDIKFLCKEETGVCADIELKNGVNTEKVYTEIVQKLRNFFSPSPRFYTLPQMLDKGKAIDEIFAGRPYNVSESHGFADTEELELLTLKKEIHLSDVYNVLFDVEGVKNIRNLQLTFCKKDKTQVRTGSWKVNIPKDHIPEFSIDCSGFKFSRNGALLPVDFKKLNGLFRINFSNNGKILYKAPSAYLDSEIPYGSYRSDLADYYSIQNEFPRVYGIEEGGLSADVSKERKSQAYQLKGYLLFFDQLLANYLSQLKQVRKLFAFSASKNDQDNHTYFVNQLSTVPDLQKLLRFNISENSAGELGVEGTVMLLPVDKKKILDLIASGQLKSLDINNMKPYRFTTLADQETAVSQLKNDLTYGQFQCDYVLKTDDCIFYYLLTCSEEIALISQKYFSTKQEAIEHLSSVKYIGTFDENYRSFSNNSNEFSFDIELNLLSFSKYLQLIVEDEVLFAERRQSFLNHLLSRFAEDFTDYALLSFGLRDDGEQASPDIQSKENFLSHYDDLSSNRGRGYNYLESSVNANRVSGFENKVKAICGIKNQDRYNLCNFEVARYDQQFEVVLKIAGTSYFTVPDKFDSREDALTVAKSLFASIQDRENYQAAFNEIEENYDLSIHYAPEKMAKYQNHFGSEEEAMKVATNLAGLFTEIDPGDAVFESAYIYISEITDSTGNIVRRSKNSFPSNDEAVKAALQAVTKIDDKKLWEYDKESPSLGAMYADLKNPDVIAFINTDAFKFDINDSIVGRPDKFSYALLDKENSFKFQSADEFNSEAEARTDANELLALMANEKNYEIFSPNDGAGFFISVSSSGKIKANGLTENKTKEDVLKLQQKVVEIVSVHRFVLSIDKVPHRWKFNYLIGHELSQQYLFESVGDYSSAKDAIAAAKLFYNALPALQANVSAKNLFLKTNKNRQKVSDVKLARSPSVGTNVSDELNDATSAVNNLLTEKKEIRRLNSNANPDSFNESVSIDPVSRQGAFVYRLVDKDRIPAFFSRKFADKDLAGPAIGELSKTFKNGTFYLEICMGGNIINQRKDDKTKTTWYHYLVKCRNRFYSSGAQAGNPLILFESVQGYPTEDEAEDAFLENYLEIIHLASEPATFAETVSLREVLNQSSDPIIKNEKIVFVPAATFEALGNSDSLVTTELIKLCHLYPLRMVLFDSKEFYDLYPCEKRPEDVRTTESCKSERKKYAYYFVLLSSTDGEKWQSLKYFDSTEAAEKEFRFFLQLLWYPGNYFVDCEICNKGNDNYLVYLREVLAESAGRFKSEEEAWGNEGVENFICVSQTTGSFHLNRRKMDCCYSFYVACGNGVIYHPCKYDSPQKRDNSLSELYRAQKKFAESKAWQASENAATLELYDAKGVPFATLLPDKRDNICRTDRIDLLSQYVLSDKNYFEKEGSLMLTDDLGQTIAISGRSEITKEDWKELLQLFLCYYPISKVKSIDRKDLKNKYCIEIKIPGFNDCTRGMINEKPCGCHEDSITEEPACFIAWKSTCCYDTCAEAEQSLLIFEKLLMNFDYYQPVFDCECNSYGIEFRLKSDMSITHQRANYQWLDAATRNWRDGTITAVNPQCYSSPEMACAAVSRAKELVNCEGLHAVEHILLRPRCFPEDCQCREYNELCQNKSGCNIFKWDEPDDTCANEGDICFVPGVDPWSFIATVALPAWPERFRKKENRLLLENILYSEAPAHVLLRILWLAPHDFCCFESKYRGWVRWLSQKESCLNNFNVCDFLDFLFHRNFECLEDCQVCNPCNEDNEILNVCFDKENEGGTNNTFLSQVNDLYCWQDQQGKEYRYIDCDHRDQLPGRDPNNPDVDPAIPVLRISTTIADGIKADQVLKDRKKSSDKKKPSTSGNLRKSVGKVKTVPVISADAASSKLKSQVINRRQNAYRKVAEKIVEESKNNSTAAHARRFLADPEPSVERVEKLLSEILENKPSQTRNSKKLTKRQRQELLQTVVCFYLDRICFNGKDDEKLKELSPLFEGMSKDKINLRTIYDQWNFPEVIAIETGLNEHLIDTLFAIDKK